MLKVSTIIPAYNAARFIGKAIDSALAQGVEQQVIVIDDGSTDNTAKLVAEYGDRVELIRQRNAGVSAARNRGISHVKGDFVAFLDADDEWLPGKLQAQLSLFAADPALGTVICDEKHMTISGEVVRASFLATRRCYSQLPSQSSRLAKPITWLVQESFFPTSGVLVRKEVLARAGFFDTSLSICEDRDLWIRLALQAPVGLVPKVLLNYLTGRADSLSVIADRARWAESLYNVLNRYLKDIELAVNAENESARTLLGTVFAELGDIFWYADKMKPATHAYSYAIRYGNYKVLPKWMAASLDAAELVRFFKNKIINQSKP